MGEHPAVGSQPGVGRRDVAVPAADQEPPAREPGTRRPAAGREVGHAQPVEDVDRKREFGGQRPLVRAQGRGVRLVDGGGGTECREDAAQGGRGSRRDMQRHGGSPLTWETGGTGAGADSHSGARGGPRGNGRAPTLCLVCGVYTTCVHAVFRLAVPPIAGKALTGPADMAFMPDAREHVALTSEVTGRGLGWKASVIRTRQSLSGICIPRLAT